ncbi:LysR family transcriptional regulator [Sorangium cellulosum]|uniref:LysR family transcriptional regulator n=1 Tax=Sorangium cellulosum TaxID=56 RepID=A0A2L0ETB8_SORCE|nr:LysR family transcriptional regulator [Sorangium cellulosum]AUX42546.1 LysR family transcriptional regulator [Sorangium cellulosum]
MNISALDLNLLLVLHAVLEERSAARAARRLRVTPSAVSNSLARLRAQLGDPLVVRSGRGLVATPRAQQIAPRLRAAFGEIAGAIEGDRAFDPRATSRAFAIACSDVDQICSLPALARAFAAEMPRAVLRVASVDHLEAAGGLAGSEIDAALAPAHPLAPGHHAADLYEQDSVFVVRRGHPCARRPMTREVFNALRHIDIHVALGRGGIGNRAAHDQLAAHGLHRDIAMTVPTFTAAAVAAASTDLVAGMPRRMAESLLRLAPLAIVEPPMPGFSFRIQLVWHDRTHLDEGARCFREIVIAALRDPAPPRRRGFGGARGPEKAASRAPLEREGGKPGRRRTRTST